MRNGANLMTKDTHSQNLIDYSLKLTLRPRIKDRTKVISAALQYVLNNDLVNKSYLEKIVQELEEMSE
jgi:mannitol/fructose-specific phosphotransferase system IIA component (Ntr-type)